MISGQTRLQRYQRSTEWPLAAVAMLFLALYSVDVLVRPHGEANAAVDGAMTAIWGFFAADFLVRWSLAEPRAKWFLRHLPEVLILVLPALRPLRLLSLAVVVGVLQRVVGQNIRGRVIAYTGCGAVIIVYVAALAMLDFERDAPGTKIANFGDAVWWAITTVTTVGYGDTHPVTTPGRYVAIALMLAGVSLLGVVTATLASWIVQRVAEEDAVGEAVTAKEIEELRDEIRRLTEAVSRSAPNGAGPSYGEASADGRVTDDA